MVPEEVPLDKPGKQAQSRDEFITDVLEGVAKATMAIRMT